MGFIEQIPFIGPAAYYVLPFILVLSIVVAVHEYGHYIVAKWCGVHSDVFSLGFGPELFGWDDSKGTRWKVCLIPLGGYVKFRGDADAASARADDDAIETMTEEELAHSFPRASLWRRALIVAAGPVFNFVLAVLIFAGVAMVSGAYTDRPIIDSVVEGSLSERAGFEQGDRVVSIDGAPIDSFARFAETVTADVGATYDIGIDRDGRKLTLPFSYDFPIRVAKVTEDGAALDAGIRAGDGIVSLDDQQLANFGELVQTLSASEGQPVTVGVIRDGEPLSFELTPRPNEDPEVASKWLIGIQGGGSVGLSTGIEKMGLAEALAHGTTGMTNVLGNSMSFIADIFRGKGDSADLGGPIRIAEVSGEAADDGFASLMRLTAILSASIGLINLFPIPVLDGGHLLFYAIEAVRGRPMSERMQEVGLTIGLAMVVMLMVYATYNDVMRL